MTLRHVTKTSKSIISGSGRRTTILADSHDQYPLIDLLMTSSSCPEADHEPRRKNPPNGGGPVVVIGSALVGNEFEFPAENPGGGFEKSIVST